MRLVKLIRCARVCVATALLFMLSGGAAIALAWTPAATDRERRRQDDERPGADERRDHSVRGRRTAR